jgi:ATP-dependent Lhr-like helicase
LRACRTDPPSGEIITISAADPLNLAGIVVPGEKIPAISGRFVSFQDGIALEENQRQSYREGIAHAG